MLEAPMRAHRFDHYNPLEGNNAKLGSHGKHDRQIVLMVFLQKVLFDERITTNFSP